MDGRVCNLCKEWKPASEFCLNYHRKLEGQCRSCKNEKLRKWHEANRREALDHYGGKCVCCGEVEYAFLVFDHIDGGGTMHRIQLGGTRIGQWLKKNDWPDIVQILCANCNTAKERPGGCPHQA